MTVAKRKAARRYERKAADLARTHHQQLTDARHATLDQIERRRKERQLLGPALAVLRHIAGAQALPVRHAIQDILDQATAMGPKLGLRWTWCYRCQRPTDPSGAGGELRCGSCGRLIDD